MPYLPVFSRCTDTVAEALFAHHGLLLHHAMTLLLILAAVVVGLLVLFVDFWRPLHKEGVEVVHPVRERGKIATLKKFGGKSCTKMQSLKLATTLSSSFLTDIWPTFLSHGKDKRKGPELHVSTILDMLVHD